MAPKNNSNVSGQTAKFFSPSELTTRWGVSGMTLRRWRKAGKIRALHLGRQVRFALSEVERFESEAQA